MIQHWARYAATLLSKNALTTDGIAGAEGEVEERLIGWKGETYHSNSADVAGHSRVEVGSV